MKLASISSLFSMLSSDYEAGNDVSVTLEGNDRPGLSPSWSRVRITSYSVPDTNKKLSLASGEEFQLLGKIVNNIGAVRLQGADGTQHFVMKGHPYRCKKVALNIHDLRLEKVFTMRRRRGAKTLMRRTAVVNMNYGDDCEAPVFTICRRFRSNVVTVRRAGDEALLASFRYVENPRQFSAHSHETEGHINGYSDPLLMTALLSAFETML